MEIKKLMLTILDFPVESKVKFLRQYKKVIANEIEEKRNLFGDVCEELTNLETPESILVKKTVRSILYKATEGFNASEIINFLRDGEAIAKVFEGFEEAIVQEVIEHKFNYFSSFRK